MKILYVCTHNRCRSILSEAISNHVAPGVLTARSAGSQPAGEVHPESLKALQRAGVPTQGLRSQAMDDFLEFAPDIVITLCDSAAGESCPIWLARTPSLHWQLNDPSKLQLEGAQMEAAFDRTVQAIEARALALKAIAEREPADQWPRAIQALIHAEEQ